MKECFNIIIFKRIFQLSPLGEKRKERRKLPWGHSRQSSVVGVDIEMQPGGPGEHRPISSGEELAGVDVTMPLPLKSLPVLSH